MIEKEGLADRARVMGEMMVGRLQDLSRKFPCIGDIRTLGAMTSMELVRDRKTAEPDAELTRALVQDAGKRGLVLLSCGVRGNVIRFLAPLTATDDIINEGLDIIAASLAEMTK